MSLENLCCAEDKKVRTGCCTLYSEVHVSNQFSVVFICLTVYSVGVQYSIWYLVGVNSSLAQILVDKQLSFNNYEIQLDGELVYVL